MLFWMDHVLLWLPAIVLTGWAQAQIMRAYAAGSRVPALSGRTAAETAEAVMRAGGATGVGIETASGELSDHFDASHKVLRLSRAVSEGCSLTALGVAAHEAGHAIQETSGYPGRVVRNVVVPWTGLGSQVCWVLVVAGVWLGMERLIVLGLILFAVMLVFQLVNLRIELDASRRSREILLSTGLVHVEEDPLVARVMNAAAWTSVAATLWDQRSQWLLVLGPRRRSGRHETRDDGP